MKIPFVDRKQHGQSLPTVDNLVALSAIFAVSIDEILVIRAEEGLGTEPGEGLLLG